MTDKQLTPEEFQECLKTFRFFLYYIWCHLDLPKPTPIQNDIANYLQDGPKRRIIQAFRGVGKSFITAAYVLWLLYWNPQLKILVVSASKERADAFSIFVLRLINDIPWLQHLKPDPSKGQRNSKLSFDVGPATPDQSPSVKSVGIFGQITGSRADVIVADDIEVANNSFTQGMRDKLSEAVKEFDAILKPDPNCEITYLGTPQTEMSLYNLLQDRGYLTRIWPARVPNMKQRQYYGSRLAAIISKMENTGHTTDPQRFSDQNLAEREASYGRSGFELQFMLNTSLSDKERYPLRLADFMVMHLNPSYAPERLIWAAGGENMIKELANLGFNGDGWYGPMKISDSEDWREYDQSIMFVDPSGTGTDECGWAVVKSQGVNLYVADAGGHKLGYTDAGNEILFQIAKKHKVQKIITESNLGAGMFTNILQSHFTGHKNAEGKSDAYNCEFEEVRSTMQKELRIIGTVEPLLTGHRITVDYDVVVKDFDECQEYCTNGHESGFKYSLFYQLTHLSKDRGCLQHDDRIDALAGCLAYFVTIMDASQDRILQIAHDRDRMAEIEVFLAEGDESAVFDIFAITGDAQKAVQTHSFIASKNRWVDV